MYLALIEIARYFILQEPSDLESLRYPVTYLVVYYSDETNDMRLAPFALP